MNKHPIYSICICNYNMADTLERSLTSLLTQIDDRFEVILVDDGSTDSSVEVVEEMRLNHANLRLVALARDRRRKLGMTRNISIERAKGIYVLLHLDCDDVFGPHVAHFVKVFHEMEKCFGRDILLSGRHINMAKREFLIHHGGYRNIYRGEDRDLWRRMATLNAFIPLDHLDFIQRLPKKRSKRTINAMVNTFDHLRNDFRAARSAWDVLRDEKIRWPHMSWQLRVFRLLLLLPTWLISIGDERVPMAMSHEDFANYLDRMRGTYPEIMRRNGGDPNLSFLGSKDAIRVFETTGEVA